MKQSILGDFFNVNGRISAKLNIYDITESYTLTHNRRKGTKLNICKITEDI